MGFSVQGLGYLVHTTYVHSRAQGIPQVSRDTSNLIVKRFIGSPFPNRIVQLFTEALCFMHSLRFLGIKTLNPEQRL